MSEKNCYDPIFYSLLITLTTISSLCTCRFLVLNTKKKEVSLEKGIKIVIQNMHHL